MNAARLRDTKATNGFLDDSLALFYGEQFECLVLQTFDLLAVIMVPHPAFKTDIAAARTILNGRAQSG